MSEVDVLMPIRSPHLGWLQDALESIEKQKHVDVRLVAVLHPENAELGSLIGSLRIPTRVVAAPVEGNLSDALNVGLSVCTAPLVARLDADDIAEPLRLVKQREALEHSTRCAAVASSVMLIDARGVEIGFRRVPRSEVAIDGAMKWKNVIAHSSVTFRRDTVLWLGGYDHDAVGAEDYELWLRVLAGSRICAIDEPLVKYRIHESQISTIKPISVQTAEAVRKARLAWAHSRGDSVAAAKLRHAVWSYRQQLRRLA